MQTSFQRSLLLGLMMAGAVFLLAPTGALWAQTLDPACIATPVPACSDAINARLAELEAGSMDPEARGWARVQRAQLLAFGKNYDAAEALIRQIEDLPERGAMRDNAILAVMTELGAESVTRGRGLIELVTTPELYEAARAHHIIHLSRSLGLDGALAEVAATDRGVGLANFALGHLVTLAIEAGRADVALGLIAAHGADDGERGALSHSMVKDLAAAGKLDAANAARDAIADSLWRAVAQAELAAAAARAGKGDEAERLFTTAREDLAVIADAQQREYAFAMMAEAMVAAGRVDLARATIADLSSFPLDVAGGLGTLLQLMGKDVPEATWRPFAEEAIAILDDSPKGDPAYAELQDDAWSDLASAIATVGDTGLAVEVLSRISDKDRYAREFDTLVHTMIDASVLTDVYAMLADHPDGDLQVQALLRLATVAQTAGSDDLAERAYGDAVGMVEGPDVVEVSDYTISELARYESSIGNYPIAETRLRFVADPVLQAQGRVANLGFAAMNGSDADFDTYFAIATDSIDQQQEPDLHLLLTQNLLVELVRGGKDSAALELVGGYKDTERRNQLLGRLAMILSGTRFTPALEAVNRITDPQTRFLQEHAVLMNALRVSFANSP